MAGQKNHYETLGVARDADQDAIKKAYRALARQHHPDQNPGDKRAEATFVAVGEAYEILGDAEKRRSYDMERLFSMPRSVSSSGVGLDVDGLRERLTEAVAEGAEFAKDMGQEALSRLQEKLKPQIDRAAAFARNEGGQRDAVKDAVVGHLKGVFAAVAERFQEPPPPASKPEARKRKPRKRPGGPSSQP